MSLQLISDSVKSLTSEPEKSEFDNFFDKFLRSLKHDSNDSSPA